jgi:hypothetical protein
MLWSIGSSWSGTVRVGNEVLMMVDRWQKMLKPIQDSETGANGGGKKIGSEWG